MAIEAELLQVLYDLPIKAACVTKARVLTAPTIPDFGLCYASHLAIAVSLHPWGAREVQLPAALTSSMYLNVEVDEATDMLR